MQNPFPKVERSPQSRCRFAIATADITPPADIYHRMWGAAKHERATGVHRPLRASVAVFAPVDTSATDTPQILVALDHCILGTQEHHDLVERIATRAQIDADQILVVLSHTHGAGLMGLDRTGFPGGDLIPGYLESVGETCGRLASEALAKARPAWTVYGTGRCTLARYRDYHDASRCETVVGYTPDYPADDTVIVARFTDDAGNLLATMVNYACHPTTLAWENTLISPDFVGAMREVVEREFPAPCLFLQGASGELGPREGFVGDPAIADRNGRELGFAALSALVGLPKAGAEFFYKGAVVSGATLGVWDYRPLPEEAESAARVWRRVRWKELLRYRAGLGTIEEVDAEREALRAQEETARASGDAVGAADLRALVERNTRLLHRLKQLPRGTHFPLQVVLWSVGDAVWIGVQGESYSILQTELRARFPNRTIVVATIAADWSVSYLPPRALYGKDIYQERISAVEAGSLETLIESIAQRISP